MADTYYYDHERVRIRTARRNSRCSRLRLGSLFSGFGGLDLAVEQVFGAETAWVSDIETGPCRVLAHRFPGVPNLGDITNIDWHAVPEVDIIAGGSPCQDISSAGRMAGMVEGTRSNLWVQMREAIAVLQPMFVVWENVGAARSTKAASRFHPEHIDRAIAHHLAVAKGTRHAKNRHHHTKAARRLMESRARRLGVPYPKPSLRALGRVLGDLADLGFDSEFIALRAADVGAPHGRLRYFVVAANARGQSWLQRRLATTGQAPGGWALGELAGRDRAPVALLPTPMTQDAANTAGESQMDRNSLPLNTVVTLLPTPSAGNFNDGEDPERWEERRQRVMETSANGNGMGMPLGIAVQLLPTPRATDGEKGGPNHDGQVGLAEAANGLVAEQAWGPYEPAIRRWESLLGPAPAPTKPGRNGRPKLNPAFAEWMMGAAPGWITDVPEVTDNEALRMAGNGVVQQQAVAALRVMRDRMAQWGTAA